MGGKLALALYLGAFALWLAFVGGVVYTAIHFVIKFW